MSITLAFDAMGGDFGPRVVVAGVNLALEKGLIPSDTAFIFCGSEEAISFQLKQYPALSKCSRIVHSDIIITSDMKPASAVRFGRKSNMAQAIDLVARGEAQAVVSAGNTGAYMALSKIILKTLNGIDRPAIPAVLPTIKGKNVVLDLGANIDCSVENLVQFAIMGEALSSYLLDIEKPSIGLLNVGTEELKGNATIQLTAQKIREISKLSFFGFVEGDDIAKGTTDVVVTDGFSGNVALKAIEGTARLMRFFLKESFEESILGKIGYLIARKAFTRLQNRMDPRLYNGAVFLGLRHVAVKSHGGTDAIGFAQAVRVSSEMVKKNLIGHLEKRLADIASCEENESDDAILEKGISQA